MVFSDTKANRVKENYLYVYVGKNVFISSLKNKQVTVRYLSRKKENLNVSFTTVR